MSAPEDEGGAVDLLTRARAQRLIAREARVVMNLPKAEQPSARDWIVSLLSRGLLEDPVGRLQ